jgi:hypothetical protein
MSELESRLIDTAQDLCRRTGKRPREAFMRRAVSTAYYAMFHALCRLCADGLIGGIHARTAPYLRVYRALDHTPAKKILRSNEAASLHPAIAAFGDAFAVLQEMRYRADYDPLSFRYYFDDTKSYIDLAESAIIGTYAIGQDERRALATLLLFRARS